MISCQLVQTWSGPLTSAVSPYTTPTFACTYIRTHSSSQFVARGSTNQSSVARSIKPPERVPNGRSEQDLYYFPISTSPHDIQDCTPAAALRNRITLNSKSAADGFHEKDRCACNGRNVLTRLLIFSSCSTDSAVLGTYEGTGNG